MKTKRKKPSINPARVAAYIERFTAALKASRARNVKIPLGPLAREIETKAHPMGEWQIFSYSNGSLNSFRVALGELDRAGITRGSSIGWEPIGQWKKEKNHSTRNTELTLTLHRA